MVNQKMCLHPRRITHRRSLIHCHWSSFRASQCQLPSEHTGVWFSGFDAHRFHKSRFNFRLIYCLEAHLYNLGKRVWMSTNKSFLCLSAVRQPSDTPPPLKEPTAFSVGSMLENYATGCYIIKNLSFSREISIYAYAEGNRYPL